MKVLLEEIGRKVLENNLGKGLVEKLLQGKSGRKRRLKKSLESYPNYSLISYRRIIMNEKKARELRQEIGFDPSAPRNYRKIRHTNSEGETVVTLVAKGKRRMYQDRKHQ